MLKNYVHETATGTTWPLALQGPLVTGYRTVLGAFGAGKKALLTVRNRSTPSEWETALYTVNADGSINRVAADVRDGTNGVGVLTVFTAGVKDVICDADAALLLALAAKSYWGGTTTNSGNTYAVTVSEPIPTAYFAPMVVLAVINAANTGAATINVNGLGAKAITKSGTTALAAGDLPANAMVALTYDGTQFQLSTGAGAGTSGGGWTVVSKAVAYTVLATDGNTYFLCSGSFTLSLTAAATMGAGTVIGVKNNGTGSITIDPNGAETINGVSTLALFQGDTVLLICDGANWHLMDSYVSQGSPTFSNSTVFTNTGTFTVPAGVTMIRVGLWGGGGGGAGSEESGTNGGTSSFGGLLSATGGGGATTTTGGTGGTGSGSGATIKNGAAGGDQSTSGYANQSGGSGGASSGGPSGSAIAGERGTNTYGGAGGNGSGGAAGGARKTTYGIGNSGAAGSGRESGGGGGGGLSTSGYEVGGNGGTPGAGGGAAVYSDGGGRYGRAGGGSAAFVEAVLSVMPGASYSITVGAAGLGGNQGANGQGGNGAPGKVVVEY